MRDEAKPCAVCGANRFSRIAAVGSGELERCRRCGLVVNRVAASSRASGEYYGENYEGLYGNYYRVFRERQFREALGRLSVINLPGRRILDIGCSYGWFLKEAKMKGWDCIGAEPSRKVFDEIASDKDLNVYNCGVEGIGGIEGKFDLITMWNVFEHLADPNGALEKMRDKLTERGVLLLCVPDAGGLVTRMSFLVYFLTFGRVREHLVRLYQLDNDYPHLFHYSRKNLKTILRNNGFEPFFAWGQDIVDADNLGERVKGYAGENGPGKALLVAALKGLLALSRLTGMQDELVVLARKK